MAVQLMIPYETLVALVEQLPSEEQQDLLRRLQGHARQPAIRDAEWRTAFRSLAIDRPLAGPIPPRRAEWYDDDGR